MTKLEAAIIRYDKMAMLLHWLTAAAVFFMLGLGFYMIRLPRGLQQLEYYQLHKSIGITILALTLFRLLWKLVHPGPPLRASLKPWKRIYIKTSLNSLYALLIALPLTGWASVSAAPLALPTRLYGLITWPHIPFIAAMENKKAAFKFFTEGHEVLVWIIIALLILHVRAALTHHFIIKDNMLRQMLP